MKQILRYSFLLALVLTFGVSNAKTVRVYKKATKVESGKAYLVAANVDGKLKVAMLDTRNYGYLNVADAIDTDGTVEMEDNTNDYTITSIEGGYTIMMSNKKYLYQKGIYTSFNFDTAPTEGHVWTIEVQNDGTFKITNNSVNKYIQYSTSHTSYGSYADAQEGGVLPFLYVYDSEKEVSVDPNAKGQEANPYTVEEVQALTSDNYPSAKVWVKGYIAGCVNTSKGSELSTADYVNSNIGLSATAEVQSVIPIQLPSGTVRTALNLVDNGTNKGKEVLVFGNITTYCSVTGVKNVSDYKLTGNSVTITTGIEALKAGEAEGAIYNLAGQRVEKAVKGLYIKNGKKFIVK